MFHGPAAARLCRLLGPRAGNSGATNQPTRSRHWPRLKCFSGECSDLLGRPTSLPGRAGCPGKGHLICQGAVYYFRDRPCPPRATASQANLLRGDLRTWLIAEWSMSLSSPGRPRSTLVRFPGVAAERRYRRGGTLAWETTLPDEQSSEPTGRDDQPGQDPSLVTPASLRRWSSTRKDRRAAATLAIPVVGN